MNKKQKPFNLLLLLILSFLISPVQLLAHVGYVVSENEIDKYKGIDLSIFYSAIAEPANVLLIIGTIAVIIVLWFFLKKSSFAAQYFANIQKKVELYFELTPWMMRLGLGIALIGAGTANVFISPVLSEFSQFAFIQILLGFLLLTGFLLVPAAAVVTFLFLLALSKNFYLLGNIDFLALSVALFVVADPKPGIDDLFSLKFPAPLASLRQWVPLILRIGIGGAMMFLAVYEKFLNPHLSSLVIENYRLTSIIPVSAEMWVLSAGLIEFLVGLLLFIGFQTRLISAVAFFVLTLSFFYFQEAVYSHITLFTTLSILFIAGSKKLKTS